MSDPDFQKKLDNNPLFQWDFWEQRTFVGGNRDYGNDIEEQLRRGYERDLKEFDSWNYEDFTEENREEINQVH